MKNNIKTLEELREIKNQNPDEFIVITDSVTGDMIHSAMCSFVKDENFAIKVLENNEKFGEYYHFKTYEESKQQIPSISICKFCSKYFKERN